MEKETMKMHGAFSWNELNTHDMDAAKAFYSEFLGWTFGDMDGGPMKYSIAKTGDVEIAGIMTPPDADKNMPPFWLAYVTVDNVDKRAQRAESLGGKIHVPPTDMPDVGRFSLIEDPEGAMLGIITYLEKG